MNVFYFTFAGFSFSDIDHFRGDIDAVYFLHPVSESKTYRACRASIVQDFGAGIEVFPRFFDNSDIIFAQTYTGFVPVT